MKIKIYPDTSVFGGVFDKEFSEWSNQLFDEFSLGNIRMMISDLTLRELEAALDIVRAVLNKIPTRFIDYVFLDEEAKLLAEKYILEQVVPDRFLLDAQHIAFASMNRVDILVSWNFKHIVNFSRIRLYNAINLKYGYPMLEIRSSREVI